MCDECQQGEDTFYDTCVLYNNDGVYHEASEHDEAEGAKGEQARYRLRSFAPHPRQIQQQRPTFPAIQHLSKERSEMRMLT